MGQPKIPKLVCIGYPYAFYAQRWHLGMEQLTPGPTPEETWQHRFPLLCSTRAGNFPRSLPWRALSRNGAKGDGAGCSRSVRTAANKFFSSTCTYQQAEHRPYGKNI